MKKILFAALVLGIGVSSASGQAKHDNSVPAGTVRVAVVNIGLVFNGYKKATRFSNEFEDLSRRFKLQLKSFEGQIKELQEENQRLATSPDRMSQIETEIKNKKRQLEDLTRQIGKKQEETLIELWKDMRDGIRSFATQHDIQLVLGYGDPRENEQLHLFPNANRKMQAMDEGGALPIFVGAGVDISEAVTVLLNAGLQKSVKTAKQPGTTACIAVLNMGIVLKKSDKARDFKPMGQAGMPSVARQREDNQLSLWQDIRDAVKTHATQHGIRLVLAYSDPADQEVLEQFPNVSRKMQAMDLGGMTPLFVAPEVDIAEAVVVIMNRKSK